MTRPRAQITRALALHSRGLSASTIAEHLGIPRSTVRDWIYGGLPRVFLSGISQCTVCGGAHHRYEELPPSYVYLLGLYLGDGSIATHPRGVYRLRLSLDPAYPGIIDEAVRATEEVLPQNKVTHWKRPSRDVEVYSYSKAWPCLFPHHGPGKKHLRRIALTRCNSVW